MSGPRGIGRRSGIVRSGERREVVMLFTDIEGSTRLARAYGERWGTVLARYEWVLTETVHRCGGHVERVEGDGAFVLFDSAGCGFSAAVALQRAFAAEEWPGPPLLTRMGLHGGPVSRPAATLVGLEIHRAARVASAANGGQLIVTDRIQRELAAEAQFDDLGEFRLKDFPEAQRLFHAVIDGRRAEFPAPRAAQVRLNNLPPELGILHGRDPEVAHLLAALASHRLVTLAGAAGVGKSRLALAVAVRALDECEGGVWWVSLESLGDAGGVATEIASALAAHGPDATDAVAARVAGRRTIVVLDAAEHLVPEVNGQIARLVSTSAELRLLVTSQRRLGLDGEHVIRLDPLGPAAARELFCERALAARPDIAIAPEIADAICARAEQHPLTLELAAARLMVLSPAQLLERMGRLLPLLGAPDAGRRKSLRESIEWTLSLLDPTAAEIFAGLGVFAGRVPIDFVEAVLDHPALLDGLQALAELAIVRLDEAGDRPPTIGMAAPLREAAVDRLAASRDRDRLAERHFGALSAYHAPVRWSIAARSTDRLRAETVAGEIRAARTWAQTHNAPREITLAAQAGESWAFSGRFGDGVAWLRRVTETRQSTRDWALATAALARVTSGFGDADEELRARVDDAVAVLAGSSAAEHAQGLIARALVCAHAGRAARATADALTAREVARDDENLTFITTVLSAQVHAIVDDGVTGRALLDAAVALTPDPDLQLVAAMSTLAGDFALMRGDGAAAASAYAASLDQASRRGDVHQVTNDLAGLAAALATSGDAQRALEVLGIAERSAADLGRPVQWTGTLARHSERHLAEARRDPGAGSALERGHMVPPGLRVARALELHRQSVS